MVAEEIEPNTLILWQMKLHVSEPSDSRVASSFT